MCVPTVKSTNCNLIFSNPTEQHNSGPQRTMCLGLWPAIRFILSNLFSGVQLFTSIDYSCFWWRGYKPPDSNISNYSLNPLGSLLIRFYELKPPYIQVFYDTEKLANWHEQVYRYDGNNSVCLDIYTLKIIFRQFKAKGSIYQSFVFTVRSFCLEADDLYFILQQRTIAFKNTIMYFLSLKHLHK